MAAFRHDPFRGEAKKTQRQNHINTKLYSDRSQVTETWYRKVEIESSSLVWMALCEGDYERR